MERKINPSFMLMYINIYSLYIINDAKPHNTVLTLQQVSNG